MQNKSFLIPFIVIWIIGLIVWIITDKIDFPLDQYTEPDGTFVVEVAVVGLSGDVVFGTQLRNFVGLLVDDCLHVALAGIAELLDHRGLQVGYGIHLALAVGVDGAVQLVGLVDGLDACLVALLRGEQTVVAAALRELTCEVAITLLEGVDYLEEAHAVCGCQLRDGGLHVLNCWQDSVVVLAHRSGEVLDGCTTCVSLCSHGLKRELSVNTRALTSTALTAPVAISIASEKVLEHAGDDGEAEEVGQVCLSVSELSAT